jgi:hypothetical protein
LLTRSVRLQTALIPMGEHAAERLLPVMNEAGAQPALEVARAVFRPEYFARRKVMQSADARKVFC